jgi:diaminopimelate epimerase
LLGPLPSTKCDFGLRILNPDGSEAEKSGNGLRIFARWIVDNGLSSASSFTVETAGGPVSCSVSLDGSGVTVEMGVVSFESSKIPVTGAVREVIEETLVFGEQELRFCAATVGNPHCVVLVDRPSPEIAQQLGPLIECHPIFPYRTNVQFMQILDRSNIRIEIWERGAGYTLASGSSSTAAAAVAHKLDLCDRQIMVHMSGGQLAVSLDSNFAATMSGPVTKICEGTLSDELFSKLGSEF